MTARREIEQTLVAARSALLRMAAALVGREADDLYGETCLRALQHAEQYSPGTDCGAWVRAIMRNLARSFFRSRAALRTVGDGLLETIASTDEPTDERMAARELGAQLTEAVSELRPGVASMLINSLDVGCAAAADAAGVNRSTARAWVYRAKVALRERFADGWIAREPVVAAVEETERTPAVETPVRRVLRATWRGVRGFVGRAVRRMGEGLRRGPGGRAVVHVNVRSDGRPRGRPVARGAPGRGSEDGWVERRARAA